MNSFPVITNDLIITCFSRFKYLYSGDQVKLLQAAQKATAGEILPFKYNGTSISAQITAVESRIKRTTDKYGQKLLVKIIENLYEDLKINGALGVTNADFLDCTKIILQDKSEIKYNVWKKWHWVWALEVDGNPGFVDCDIRVGNTASGEIVPDYILQYIQQGVTAFKNGRCAVAMALMTIALEGTLRDALETKGFSYQRSAPAQDVYEITDIQIHKDSAGYKVTFPNTMPLSYLDYLSSPNDPAYKSYKIKRVKKSNGDIVLEMRQSLDLLDYWSSNVILIPGSRQVSGLGAALDIGRKHLGIITNVDLPDDLDILIQSVRNNLIHLSGSSMTEIVLKESGVDITLGDFLNNKNRVFDTICTIGSSINSIYNRIKNGTL